MTSSEALRPDRTASLDTYLETCLDPKLFKALGDSNRLILLARLARSSRPLTVTEASSCCGVHLSGVSRHLKILLDAGILQAERDGREVRYRVDCGAVVTLLRGLADAFEQCQMSCRPGESETCCNPANNRETEETPP